MPEIARFMCPHCLEETTFRRAVLDSLFGAEPVGSSVTYPISCQHCRKHFLLVVNGSITAAQSEPRRLGTEP